MLNHLGDLNITPKDAKSHLKTMRFFFFVQCIGQLCRIRKIDTQKENVSQNESPSPDSQLVIEGLFSTCDSNSSYFILREAVILKVFGPDPYEESARTELIRRANLVSVKMSEVKEIRFMGIDVSRAGVQKLSPPSGLRTSRKQVREEESTGDKNKMFTQQI